MIASLTNKINDAKIADPLEETVFDFGFHQKKLQQILNYWKNEYLLKWSKREEYLNQFPQFTTEIQG